MLQTNQTAPSPTAMLASNPLHRFVVDRVDDFVRIRRDADDRIVGSVGDPDSSFAGRDVARKHALHRDRPLHLSGLRVDPGECRVVQVRDPDGALAEVHGPGRFPTSTSATTLFVFGSMTATEFGLTAIESPPPRKASRAMSAARRQRRQARRLSARCSLPSRGMESLPPARELPGAATGDRALGCRELQRLVLLEDRLLQTLKRRARLDPELVHERAPRPLICVECLRLATGPVEREHQLSAQALSKGVLGDKRLQLGDQLAMEAEREVGFDPLLDS